MRIFSTLFLLLYLSSSLAESDFEVMLKEHNFFGRYTHQLYIKDDVLVYIDEHWPKEQSNTSFKLPIISSKKLDESEKNDLIDKLKELGIANWKPEYPEPKEGTGLICDGLSFVIYIKADGLDVRTVGACETPINYEEVTKLLGVN